MKKWQKWLIAVIAVVAAITIAVICAYEFYAKDKIEKTLEKAQVVLQNEELQKEVETFVEEMVESGELETSQLEGYIQYKQAITEEKAPADSADAAPGKPKTLVDRVSEAMTAEEFAFAMSMYSKLNINYIVANMHTDREGVKTYVKSTLSSDEISRSLEIYGKYSYLLK